VRALEDADDATDRFAAVAAAVRAAQPGAESHHNLVAVDGHAGVLGGDLDRVLFEFAGRFLADDVGGAALAELESSR